MQTTVKIETTKTMSKRTRASLALRKVGVHFTLHSYDYDPDVKGVGLQAAAGIRVEPRRVLKTLMAEVDGKPVCAVVPSDREVSLKKLATAFHGKTAKMMRPTDAERTTARTGCFAGRRVRPITLPISPVIHHNCIHRCL